MTSMARDDLVTALRINGTIGHGPTLVCPSCYDGTGFCLLAHQGFAVVVCTCGVASRHHVVTEELALDLMAKPSVATGSVVDWPAEIIAEHPRLPAIAANIVSEWHTADRAIFA